jgi:hypothetical protein
MAKVIELTNKKYAADQDTKNNKGSSVNIIEFSALADGEKRELNNFYWGLGISCDEKLILIPGYGIMYSVIVEVVHSGYSGESSGLQPKDVIFQLDSKLIQPENDIKGDGPSNISLTIMRNGSIITINTKRVKVYY